MTYREYIDKKSKGINALPLKFAFGMKQFKEMMESWGLTENDTDKIYKLGDTGGFYLKSDSQTIIDYFNQPDDLEELMKDEAFRIDAFRYEMDNHEYAINWQGDWDVVNCFTDKELVYREYNIGADYLNDIGHPEWIDSYMTARASHLKAAENW